MDELNNASKLVNYWLINDKHSRNSDNYLFYVVARQILEEKGIDINKIGFKDLFLSLRDFGVPQFETVGRVRRKLQAEFPELKGNENVSMRRLLNQDRFIEFSK